jgi:hypothetical protein
MCPLLLFSWPALDDIKDVTSGTNTHTLHSTQHSTAQHRTAWQVPYVLSVFAHPLVGEHLELRSS